jgi:hypothetical protein
MKTLFINSINLIVCLFISLSISSCKKDDNSSAKSSSTTTGTYYTNVNFNGTNYSFSQNSSMGTNGGMICQGTNIGSGVVWGISCNYNNDWGLAVTLQNNIVGNYFASFQTNNSLSFADYNSQGGAVTYYASTNGVNIIITNSTSTYIEGTFSGTVNKPSSSINYPISGSFKIPYN